MDSREDRVRRRAYELWEEAGRSGDPEDRWFRAEREVTDLPSDAASSPMKGSSEEVTEPSGAGESPPNETQDVRSKRPARGVNTARKK